jgi:RNA polymerase sigma-70 factor (ECF subfamily)
MVGDHALAWLLASTSRGDTVAFAFLYDILAARVHGMVCGVLGKGAVADQLTVDVFTDVWASSPTYEESETSPLAWVMAIAHRHAVDRLRSSGRTDETPGATRSSGDRSTDPLSEASRRALDAAYFGGRTHQQIDLEVGRSGVATLELLRSALRELCGFEPMATTQPTDDPDSVEYR